MSATGYTMQITIQRLPSGNFNMLNERGYLICRVVDGSELAKFIEKQFEIGEGLFTLTTQLKATASMKYEYVSREERDRRKEIARPPESPEMCEHEWVWPEGQSTIECVRCGLHELDD